MAAFSVTTTGDSISLAGNTPNAGSSFNVATTGDSFSLTSAPPIVNAYGNLIQFSQGVVYRGTGNMVKFSQTISSASETGNLIAFRQFIKTGNGKFTGLLLS